MLKLESRKRQDKRKNIITQGSYTVEAAFVMPMIIFIVIALIYMSFYMHDKSRIQSILDTAITQSSLMIKHEMDSTNREIDYEHIDARGIYYPVIGSVEKERNAIIEMVKAQLSSGLFIANIENITVEADHLDIQIKVCARMKISILKVKEFFYGSGTQVTITSRGRVHYPAEFVRRFDVVEGVAHDIKGYDEIILKLQKIIKKTDK